MPEAPHPTTPEDDPFGNPGQPMIVLGVTAGAFALLATAARLFATRAATHVVVRGAAAVAAPALGGFAVAAVVTVGTGVAVWQVGNLLGAKFPNPITGLKWRRYPPPEC